MKTPRGSLLAGKVSKPRAKVRPSSKDELEQLINEHIKEIKPRPGQEVDLNWIDASLVDNLSGLFKGTNYIPAIDTWKIDHVKDFSYMFTHNKHIVRSPLPVLQKKLLKRECYNSMFYDCTALKEPPVLPATELTDGCYTAMFDGCTTLADPPVLPATKLTPYCYTSMFTDCTALKEPPALPATELAPYCYTSMFTGCTTLTRAPELPATKLTPYCYSCMFSECTALVEPPELPATELAVDCYYAMFAGCKSLKRRATVPAGVLISNHYGENMYYGCPCENK